MIDAVATGLRIRQIMDEQNITPKQLARKIGVTQYCIYNWFDGRRLPNLQSTFEMCRALNVTINDIVVEVKWDCD